MSPPDDRISRRSALVSLSAVIGSLAGCNSSGSSDPEPSTRASSTPETGRQTTRTETESPTTRTETEPPTTTETQSSRTPSDRVVSRLTDRAIPLTTVDPLADLDDLDSFASAFEDATIVGMGEATHGTREFFRMKHRLLRYMVQEQGLRVFALEANFSEALLTDDYVAGGDVSAQAALDNIGFWTWDTEAVLSMLEWLRSFNEGRDEADRVRFYGFDAQFTDGPARKLRTYFERTDPAFLDTVGADLSTIAESGVKSGREAVPERIALVEELVPQIRDRLDTNRERYEAATGERAWQLADRHLFTMERATAYADARGTQSPEAVAGIRDEAMADHVTWLSEYEDRSIALWAHNTHIRNTSIGDTDSSWMGKHLTERFGEDYYAIGFDFSHGSVRSRTAGNYEFETFELDRPPGHTLSATLGAVDYPLYALDLRSLDPSFEPALDFRYGVHTIGAVYNPSWPLWRRYYPFDHTTFDGLVFVEESTATTLLDDESQTPTETTISTTSTDG